MLTRFINHKYFAQFMQFTDQKKKLQKQLRVDLDLSVYVPTTQPQI